MSVLSGFSLCYKKQDEVVLLFASCGLLSFCCFVLNFVFFSFLSKKDPQKTGHNKNQKKSKNARKKTTKKNQLAQLCSQIVFLIFGGWA